MAQEKGTYSTYKSGETPNKASPTASEMEKKAPKVEAPFPEEATDPHNINYTLDDQDLPQESDSAPHVRRGRKRMASPGEKTMPVKLLKGYVPLSGGDKIRKGNEVDLPLSEAKGLIKKGVAERADPLPGDDD